MRFIVRYKVGKTMREDVIEAQTIDEAEKKADKIHPTWQDLRFQNLDNAREILQAV